MNGEDPADLEQQLLRPNIAQGDPAVELWRAWKLIIWQSGLDRCSRGMTVLFICSEGSKPLRRRNFVLSRIFHRILDVSGRVYQNLLISYRIIRLLPLYLYVLYGFRRTRRARVLEKEAKSVPRMHIILSPDALIGVDGKRYAANINWLKLLVR